MEGKRMTSDKTKILRIFGIIILILTIAFSMVYLIKYDIEHPCTKYKIICQKSYTEITQNGLLFMTTINYKTVDCLQPHDREIQQCIERK